MYYVPRTTYITCMGAVMLIVKDLKVVFDTDDGVIKAVDGIDLSLYKGDVLAIVGESGCGKSVTALSLLGLISPPGKITGGEILFKGENILTMPEDRLRAIRGKEISMIFQNPFTSLNPVLKIGDQISETIETHEINKIDKGELFFRTVKALEMVGLRYPEKIYHYYPHMLSGGMQQRVMIAMALSSGPDLLLADEPTTALDVTVSSQILKLLRKLKEELGISIILITHNFGIVSEISNKAMVMYLGKEMEFAPTAELIKNPLHPYTQGLINSIPSLVSVRTNGPRFFSIAGSVHQSAENFSGCRFYPRCLQRTPKCMGREPDFREITPGHFARCILL